MYQLLQFTEHELLTTLLNPKIYACIDGICVSHESRGSRVRNPLRGNRFRLGNKSGVDDQLEAVTSVSGRSRCSKRYSSDFIFKLRIAMIKAILKSKIKRKAGHKYIRIPMETKSIPLGHICKRGRSAQCEILVQKLHFKKE
ncbi:hypothetical protein BpHYR1_044019 [Brachionus plicatilis]|uniref:Uncharacterized protein n=1 Tax=Brachionus plicatilis TaxID=10195 RepID=A0A3M7PZH6_BRAPC|nr:hypothetical protein BpHYR1_044019 [Brachionus plicatilis]